ALKQPMTASATHKHLFYSEMAKLLEAGFDIRKAAAVLSDTQLPAAQVALLKDLNQGLEAGQSITGSFAKNTKSITELERHIIGAGERGGKLAPAFQHLADYFGMLATARREALKSLIYPVIVLHLGILIGSVPTALMNGEKSVGEILGGLLVTLFIVYAAVFVIVLGIRAVLKMAPEKPGIDRLINRLPWLGNARRNLAMARFCKVYHSCVLAGISMSETARLATDASHSGVIRKAGNELVRVAQSGSALGPQFLADHAFPKTFARSYATGEEAGTLDTDLARWSKLFREDAEACVKTVAVMLPKVLYFLILGFAAWKIIGFYSGYFQLIEGIGE
ncbi:MAG TPA: type II secretion system F family protein, partial [Luteolibacter sp.]